MEDSSFSIWFITIVVVSQGKYFKIIDLSKFIETNNMRDDAL